MEAGDQCPRILPEHTESSGEHQAADVGSQQDLGERREGGCEFPDAAGQTGGAIDCDLLEFNQRCFVNEEWSEEPQPISNVWTNTIQKQNNTEIDKHDVSKGVKGPTSTCRTKHTGDKPYKCGECGYRTDHKSYLRKHLRIHTGEKPYKCTQCDYATNQRTNLRVHKLATHTEEKPYVCHICGLKTAYKSNLYQHMKTHSSDKQYKCSNCSYSTARKPNLDQHLLKHSGEKPFSCVVCGHRSTCQAYLNKHMKIHAREKPYKCQQCDYSTHLKGNFDVHMTTHTGEKPYMCGECGLRTAYRSNLLVHMRVHTGDKPYKCSYCSYSAARKVHLDQHMAKHTGEKPFSCAECGYKTASKSYLSIHFKNHTRMKPQKSQPSSYSTVLETSLDVHMAADTDESQNTFDQSLLNFPEPEESSGEAAGMASQRDCREYLETVTEYVSNMAEYHATDAASQEDQRDLQTSGCEPVNTLSDQAKTEVHDSNQEYFVKKENLCETSEEPCPSGQMLDSYEEKQYFTRKDNHDFSEGQEDDSNKCVSEHSDVETGLHVDVHMASHSDEELNSFDHSLVNFPEPTENSKEHQSVDMAGQQDCTQHEENETEPMNTSAYKVESEFWQPTQTQSFIGEGCGNEIFETPQIIRPISTCTVEKQSNTRGSNHNNHDVAKEVESINGNSMTNHAERKPYMCEDCGYRTDYKTSLKTHMRIHTGEKPYQCTQCDYSTTQKTNLNVHMAAHTGEKPYVCHVCGLKTAYKSNLSQHMKTHSSDKPYKCSCCSYSAARKTHLHQHMSKHTGEKPFSCEQCEYRTACKSHLSKHMQIHSSEKPYKCKQCDYSTYLKGNLHEHMASHTGEKPYMCGVCGLRTAYRSNMSKHMRMHTGDKPYKCSYCSYSAARKPNLDQHMSKHTGEKPFSCGHCEYKTACNSHLSKHMQIHSNKKPYKCKQCDYSTYLKRNLDVHITTHTGEKPYMCGVCGLRTAYRSTLSVHMRVHTGDKPYKCSYCSYSATRKRNLDQHMSKHTGKKPFSCGQCKYKTACKSHLSKHMKTHSKREIYKCKCCDYSTLLEASLIAHVATHTGEDLNPLDETLLNIPEPMQNDGDHKSASIASPQDWINIEHKENNTEHVTNMEEYQATDAASQEDQRDLQTSDREPGNTPSDQVKSEVHEPNQEYSVKKECGYGTSEVPGLFTCTGENQNRTGNDICDFSEIEEGIISRCVPEHSDLETSLDVHMAPHNVEKQNTFDHSVLNYSEPGENSGEHQTADMASQQQNNTECVNNMVEHHTTIAASQEDQRDFQTIDCEPGNTSGNQVKTEVCDSDQEYFIQKECGYGTSEKPCLLGQMFTCTANKQNHIRTDNFSEELKGTGECVSEHSDLESRDVHLATPAGKKPNTFYQSLFNYPEHLENREEHQSGSMAGQQDCRQHQTNNTECVPSMEEHQATGSGSQQDERDLRTSDCDPNSSTPSDQVKSEVHDPSQGYFVKEESLYGSSEQPCLSEQMTSCTFNVKYIGNDNHDVSKVQEGNISDCVPEHADLGSSVQVHVASPTGGNLNSLHHSLLTSPEPVEDGEHRLADMTSQQDCRQPQENETDLMNTSACKVESELLYPNQTQSFIGQECRNNAVETPQIIRPKSTCTVVKQNSITCDNRAVSKESESSTGRIVTKRAGDKPYMCGECGYRTDYTTHLKSHMRVHTGERPFKCTQCDYSTTQQTNLKVHMAAHTGEKPYICQECGFRTAYKTNLSHHMKTHTGIKPYTCSYCSYSSTRKTNLRQHMLKHSGEKPFSCVVCGHRSTCQAYLNKHMKIHAREKPHSCQQCDYSTYLKANLDEHMATHTGQKPYVCGVCGFRTAYRSNLLKHIKVHTGDKPYKCTQCNYCTRRQDCLKKHIEKHTRDMSSYVASNR